MKKASIIKPFNSVVDLVKEGKTTVQNLTIASAYTCYINGDFSPWDLQEVVELYGYKGWVGRTDGSLELYK
jgi:hypothetical protein